jgi:hypothetical protein
MQVRCGAQLGLLCESRCLAQPAFEVGPLLRNLVSCSCQNHRAAIAASNKPSYLQRAHDDIILSVGGDARNFSALDRVGCPHVSRLRCRF